MLLSYVPSLLDGWTWCVPSAISILLVHLNATL